MCAWVSKNKGIPSHYHRTHTQQKNRTDLERGAEGGDELGGELLDEAHRVGQQDLGEGALELRQRQLAGVGVLWVVMSVGQRIDPATSSPIHQHTYKNKRSTSTAWWGRAWRT